MLFIPLTPYPYRLVPLQGTSGIYSPSRSLLLVDTPSQAHGTGRNNACMRGSGSCLVIANSRAALKATSVGRCRARENKRRKQDVKGSQQTRSMYLKDLFWSWLEIGAPTRREPLVKDQGSFDTPLSSLDRTDRRIQVGLLICSISETKDRPWIPQVIHIYACTRVSSIIQFPTATTHKSCQTSMFSLPPNPERPIMNARSLAPLLL